MKTIVIDDYTRSITIGIQQENKWRQVEYKYDPEWTGGEIIPYFLRPGEVISYPLAHVERDAEAGTVTVMLTNTDLFYPGRGALEYKYKIGDVVAKSKVFPVRISGDIASTEGDPPSGWDDWKAEVEGYATAAQESAQSAHNDAEAASGYAADAKRYKEQTEQAATDALRDIGNAKSGALDDISTAKGNAVNDVQAEAESVHNAVARILPTDSASGAIASFPDGSDLVPMQSLEVSIEPVQDLHGYDKPWSGGAGDQKYNPANWEHTTSRRTWGTDSASFVTALNSLTAGTYTAVAKFKIDALDAEAGSRTYGFLTTGVTVDGRTTIDKPALNSVVTVSKTFTITSAQVGTFTHCYWYAGSGTATGDLTTAYDIGINVGSVTDYIPYTNICPISGWDEVEAVVCGKNLWGGEKLADDIADTVPNSTKDTVNKTIKFSAAYASNRTLISGIFKENTRYTFICKDGGTSDDINIKWLYSDGTTSWMSDFTSGVSVSSSVSGKTVVALVGGWASGNTDIKYEESGVFEGVVTADDFEPYQATSHTTTLPSTVYGGTLDMVTGELTVDRAMVTYDGTEDGWGFYAGYKQANIALPSTAKYIQNTVTYLCDVFAPCANNQRTSNIGNFASLVSSGADAAFSSSAETLADFKTLIGSQPVSFCYELAQPTTYTLTPQEISVLLGTNNVWSDAGQTRVVYSADIQRYVEKKLQ